MFILTAFSFEAHICSIIVCINILNELKEPFSHQCKILYIQQRIHLEKNHVVCRGWSRYSKIWIVSRPIYQKIGLENLSKNMSL